MIVTPANDIFKQAHQGSVAAIIQVLNDKLADSGVRTRAIFANGVLQLLCEAATADQLDQAQLTERIRKVLETISPRNIRRVNINSRIVREQQLLWLEEIHRDPNGQLLWAQEIILKRPNFIRGMFEDWRETFSDRDDLPRSLSPQVVREKRQFTKGIFGGVALSVGVLMAAWGVAVWNNGSLFANPDTITAKSVQPQPAKNWQQAVNREGESFTVAVRLAERAAQAGTKAQNASQWREVADMWGEASRLMKSVPASHPRYDTAQDRTEKYRQNQQTALANVK